MSPGYAWFTAGVATWALAVGMQQVLFTWLLVGVLHESPERVGIAQMCQTLPLLALLLLGGVAADRFNRRRLLIALHAVAALTVAILAITVESERLRLEVLLVFALTWGTIQTFAQPARDALLSDVAGTDLMRAVTGSTLAQFMGLAIGTRSAGIAQSLGSASALMLDSALLVLAALPLLWLPRTPAANASAEQHPLKALKEGLDEVRHSERLRVVALLVAANGLFYMGPYLVLCPLMVRDLYRGGVNDLAFAMTGLTVGTITGSVAILWRQGVRRKGRAFLLALLTVAFCLLVLAAGPPYWAFVSVLVVWGVGHAFFLNTSRTLFQVAAPASHRARVLSVHSLGLLGMAPLSQLAAGGVASVVGPLVGCAIAGGAMVVIIAAAWSFTHVRHLE